MWHVSLRPGYKNQWTIYNGGLYDWVRLMQKIVICSNLPKWQSSNWTQYISGIKPLSQDILLKSVIKLILSCIF